MNASVPTSEILRARMAHAGGNGSVEGSASAAGAADDQISVIGADILITGNIEAEVDLHIEGRVQGDVRCSTLILGESSHVTGSIYAERVRVSGHVEGSIETIDLAIESGAYVKGDVTYTRLRIANGGIVSGKMEHLPREGEAETDEEPASGNAGPASADGPSKVHYIE